MCCTCGTTHSQIHKHVNSMFSEYSYVTFNFRCTLLIARDYYDGKIVNADQRDIAKKFLTDYVAKKISISCDVTCHGRDNATQKISLWERSQITSSKIGGFQTPSPFVTLAIPPPSPLYYVIFYQPPPFSKIVFDRIVFYGKI